MKKLFDRYWWVGSIILAIALIFIVDQAPRQRIFRIERPTAEPVSVDSGIITFGNDTDWTKPAESNVEITMVYPKPVIIKSGLGWTFTLLEAHDEEEIIIERPDKIFILLDGKKINLADWMRSRDSEILDGVTPESAHLTPDYYKGVNDALKTIMLHDLELTIKGEGMTWGERAKVVRERLNVPEEKRTDP